MRAQNRLQYLYGSGLREELFTNLLEQDKDASYCTCVDCPPGTKSGLSSDTPGFRFTFVKDFATGFYGTVLQALIFAWTCITVAQMHQSVYDFMDPDKFMDPAAHAPYWHLDLYRERIVSKKECKDILCALQNRYIECMEIMMKMQTYDDVAYQRLVETFSVQNNPDSVLSHIRSVRQMTEDVLSADLVSIRDATV